MESIVLMWQKYSFLPSFNILAPEKDELLQSKNPYKADTGIKQFHPDLGKIKNERPYKAFNVSFQDPGTE